MATDVLPCFFNSMSQVSHSTWLLPFVWSGQAVLPTPPPKWVHYHHGVHAAANVPARILHEETLPYHYITRGNKTPITLLIHTAGNRNGVYTFFTVHKVKQ